MLEEASWTNVYWACALVVYTGYVYRVCVQGVYTGCVYWLKVINFIDFFLNIVQKNKVGNILSNKKLNWLLK